MVDEIKADMPAFILAPLSLIVCAFVAAVIFMAWGQATPILQQASNTVGLPVNGSALAGAKGINQTTYLNVGNQMYNFDGWMVFVFYFVLIGAIASTLMLSPNPLGWVVGIIMAPVIYYINTYLETFAHQIMTQPVMSAALFHLPQTITVLAQLPMITELFYIGYICCLSIRIYFFSPQNPTSGRESAGNEMMRRAR